MLAATVLTQLINNNAFCRTVPPRPVVLITRPLVLVQIVQNYAQWHNLHYAQHVAHQVAQYCESYAQ